MRFLEACYKFLLLAFKPIRHIEALAGWVDVVVRLLLIIGIIANTGIGIIKEWEYWPILTVSLVALLFLYAGVRLQYRLLRAKFYLKYWGFGWTLLSPPNWRLKQILISCKLTISNQCSEPRGVSRVMLEVEEEHGSKRELTPTDSSGKMEADITLYLEPHESKTLQLYFLYEGFQYVGGSEKLYVFDDKGAYTRVKIDVDTMSKMAKTSKSRSGDYQIE